MQQVMKAIRVSSFGGPEVLKLVSDCPIPTITKGQVLVKVVAAGVNPVDMYIRSGSSVTTPQLPYTPGKDGAGTVQRVGEGVQHLKSGDRVYVCESLTGTYAEFAACDASRVHPLPANLSFSQGAAVYVPYYTAYRALLQSSHAKPGETVLVHGASGGVGVAAVQFASSYGMTVIGTAGTDEGEKVVKQAGAAFVVNHKQEGYVQKILDATDGNGPDVIIENLANVNLSKDLQMVAKRGRIVVVGSRGTIEVNPRDAMVQESIITGVALLKATELERQEIAAAVAAGLKAGFLSPIVGQEFPLSQASEAHKEIIEGKGAKGKMVLMIQ